jgi:uncharacterized repeat protein (TIGR03803 family)
MKAITNWAVKFALMSVSALVTIPSAQAQTLETLHTFCSVTNNDGDCLDGANPGAGLVQATTGNFYGTTQYGGATSHGTTFKMTPLGRLTALHDFCSDVACADGSEPLSGLMQGSNGNLYGMTFSGGAYEGQVLNEGVIFKMTLGGTLTPLVTFENTNGSRPIGSLIQAQNGELYGTTGDGGAYAPQLTSAGGTIFKMTASGTLETVHSFCGSVNGNGYCADGYAPSAGLVQASNGDFYGTTEYGGTNDAGTVFKLTPGGTLTTLYSFCTEANCADGSWPSVLIQAADGNLYGTTVYGGFGQDGTVFKITPSGQLTTIYKFCSLANCADGVEPLYAGLIQGTDGNLYGTTSSGGTTYGGTLFRITTAGTLTTLYDFCSQSGCKDGVGPQAGLIQGTNGDFYGTTYSGGTYGYGTVFSLSTGLGPFVALQSTYGKIGAQVKILGTDLTGATAVTFNGTAAAFTVVSKSEITTTVPTGATTGPVVVTTPGGVLSSSQAYTVKL